MLKGVYICPESKYIHQFNITLKTHVLIFLLFGGGGAIEIQPQPDQAPVLYKILKYKQQQPILGSTILIRCAVTSCYIYCPMGYWYCRGMVMKIKSLSQHGAYLVFTGMYQSWVSHWFNTCPLRRRLKICPFGTKIIAASTHMGGVLSCATMGILSAGIG